MRFLISVCQRLQLGIKQISPAHPQAQAAYPQCRVLFLILVCEGQRLVGTGIKRSHNNMPPSKSFKYCGINICLLFKGRGLFAPEEKEFCAEQAGTLKVECGCAFCILLLPNIGVKRHVVAVAGRTFP